MAQVLGCPVYIYVVDSYKDFQSQQKISIKKNGIFLLFSFLFKLILLLLLLLFTALFTLTEYNTVKEDEIVGLIAFGFMSIWCPFKVATSLGPVVPQLRHCQPEAKSTP